MIADIRALMKGPTPHRGPFPRWFLTVAPAIAIACLLPGGCQNAAIVENEWKVANPWGAPFADREDVLRQIPIGSPLDKIQPMMQAHGYEERSRIQHDRAMIVVFIPSDLTRLRKSFPRLEITFQLQHDIVAAVDVRALPANELTP
jgi:hypothetical protein